MADLYGWRGKILRVDLTTKKSTEVPTSNYVPKFVGGAGICARIAWDELLPEVGAFDPDNKLIFMTGPIAGTLAPASSRLHLGFISPVTYPTEDYVKSNIGGHWGAELKFAGYDGLIIQGKSPNPVWLWINDGKVEIKDAADYWGMDVYSTEEAIWDALGSKKIQIAAIGQAGENLVRYAVIMTDHGNAAGVGGAGAVMGSKNLKAVAIRGTGGVDAAKPDELADYALWISGQMYRGDARPPWGLYNVGAHRLGFGGSESEKLRTHYEKTTIKAKSCFGCPVGCFPVFSVPDAVRPAFTNICSALAWYREFDEARHGGECTTAYLKVSALTDTLGINCNELKRIIRWLEGCYEKGLLSEGETGISLNDLGEYECVERLCAKIISRDGFGDKLAEGVHRAYDLTGEIGREFIEHANRGFESTYTPRHLPTSALEAAMDSSHRKEYYHTWATRFLRWHPQDECGLLTLDEWVNVVKEIFGRDDIIDHTGDAFYASNKAWLAKWTEDYKTAICGGMELCDWVWNWNWTWYSDKSNRRGWAPQGEAKIFTLVTGMPMDVNGLLKIGERIRNLERAIMIREGRRRQDDTLGDEFFTQAKISGIEYMAQQETFNKAPGADGVFVPVTRVLDRDKFEKLKDAYYKERGWNLNTGIPTRAKLEELDLKDVADKLGL
ncbi:aldehyde ferredoxin oxidoreductase N-terminal domain-containing protein [Thermodesulfobacteriota bacterium]